MAFVSKSTLFAELIIVIMVTAYLAIKAIYLTYQPNPLAALLVRLIIVKHMIETMVTA